MRELKDRVLPPLVVTLAGVAFYMALDNLKEVLGFLGFIYSVFSPVVIGLGMAFVLAQPLNFLERRAFKGLNDKNLPLWNKLRRPACLVLTLLLAAALITAIVFLIVPQVRESVLLVADKFPAFMEQAIEKANALALKYGLTLEALQELEVDWNSIGEKALGLLKSGGDLLGSTLSAASGLLSHATNWVLGFIFAIYILAMKESLARNAKRALFAMFKKARVERLLSVLALVNGTFSSFLVGQCTEGVILGTLVYLGMTVLGMPYGVMVGTLMAVTSLIPIFGAFIGTAVGALMLLMVDPMKAVWFVVYVLVLQQVEGNLIYPKVVGKSVGLPGIWVLFAVTVSGSLFGAGAMLLSVPAMSVLYTLFREYVNKKTAEKAAAGE